MATESFSAKNFNFTYNDEQHLYQDELGNKIPSVTGVGDEFQSVPFLEKTVGKKKYGFKFIKETESLIGASTMDAASERGTNIHRAIEHFLKSKMHQDHDLDGVLKSLTTEEYLSYKKAVDAVDAFERKGNKIEYVGAEKKLAAETPAGKIAGTTDIIAKVNGKLHIIDFKSTSSIPKTVGHQTAAYRYMYAQMEGLDPDKIGRAVLWSSVDPLKQAHLVFEGQEGGRKNPIFKQTDWKDFLKKFTSFNQKGPAEATREDVIRGIKQELALRSKEKGGTMYFSTFKEWGKKVPFTMSELRDSLSEELHEKTVFQMYEDAAEELGLEIAPGLTSKKGSGVNLLVGEKRDITPKQMQEVAKLRTRAERLQLHENISSIGEEFFFLKNQNMEPVSKSLVSGLRKTFSDPDFYAKAGLGGVIGAGIGALTGVFSRDDKKLSDYDESMQMGTRMAVGAAVGSLAGPFMGNVGEHKLARGALNCFKAVPGMVVKGLRR